MADEVKGAMFDEFVQGGLLDDADVTVKTARFVPWDYQGKIQQPVLALQLVLEDAEGQEHKEHLSSGELRFFVPSGDGKKAVPVGNQKNLNSNTNAVAFIVSVLSADTRGELAAKIRSTDDISVLDGTRLHVIRKAQPKRSGIIQQPTADGQPARQAQQLIAEKVLSYSWEAATGSAPKAAPAAATSAAAPAAAAPAANGAVAEIAASVLVQIVAEAGGSIKKGMIAGKVFSNDTVKSLPTQVEKNAILGLIVKDDFIQSSNMAAMGVKYDAATGTVSLG